MKEEKSKPSNGELENAQETTSQNGNKHEEKAGSQLQTCFVIMPISDVPGYEPGHFNRVFEHVIKPACINAGYDPIRADEVRKTNYIVLDIIRKIVESDMVVCDLSSRNPNVLYELGIRQAFNKLAVLIKDDKTDRIFDIQGLRTTDYDSSLRIDKVREAIEKLTIAIIETKDCKVEEVNSLIQMLSIQPAVLPKQREINSDTQLLLSAIQDLSNKVTPQKSWPYLNTLAKVMDSKFESDSMLWHICPKISQWEDIKGGDDVYMDEDFLGKIIQTSTEYVIVEKITGGRIRLGKYMFPQMAVYRSKD